VRHDVPFAEPWERRAGWLVGRFSGAKHDSGSFQLETALSFCIPPFHVTASIALGPRIVDWRVACTCEPVQEESCGRRTAKVCHYADHVSHQQI